MNIHLFSPPEWLVQLAGLGQIFTAAIYPYIRHRVFDWYNDVKQLKPLNQEIAKTYGRYIQGLNFCFGLTCLALPADLQNGTRLALAFSLLLAGYWVGKVATQIAYYPMWQIPQRPLFRYGSWGMNGLFLLFALTACLLVATNLAAILS